MKFKTSELLGWRLDQAVAKANGYGYDAAKGRRVILDLATNQSIILNSRLTHYSPSTNWLYGGAIIEREKIGLSFYSVGSDGAWMSDYEHDARPDGCQLSNATAPTPLISAMRAFVMGKIGDEVDL
jgi:hypothetical protein